jgi:hypothetical protein
MEDMLLSAKVREFGPHWVTIAKFFDGRSENNVKNRWYTRVKGMADRSSSRPTASDQSGSESSDDLPVVRPGRILFPPIASLDVHLSMRFAFPDISGQSIWT